MAANPRRIRCALLVAMVPLMLSTAALAAKGEPGLRVSAPEAARFELVTADNRPLSPKDRGNLARQFVKTWGMYAQRVYGVPVATWSERMVPNFVAADASNFRAALKRDTFEGALAELSGTGQRLTDEAIITQLAKGGSGSSIQTLGALTNDLVYTPVAPCRIVDTRSTGAGAIAANGTRNFLAINASNFTSQGGSATNCGTLGLNATAVAVNVTAVTPAGAGYATLYPFGTAQPVAASVNYASGAIVNNALIVQIPNPLAAFDFTVYTFAQSHYVVDIVGYFAPPVATALQCVETANTDLVIAAGGTGNAVAPACGAGYTQTSTNCESSTWQMPFVFIQSGTCSAQNNSASSATLRASSTCCRVPGR